MKTNYYVNKEKGVVICKIESDWSDNYRVSEPIVTRAICSPEDIFKEQTGKDISELRGHIELHDLILEHEKKHLKATQAKCEAIEKKIKREQTILRRMRDKLKTFKGGKE